jgi:monoamine oxidase
VDRRDFIRLMAIQAAAWSLGCGRHEGGGARARGARTAKLAPPNPFSGRWMGDEPALGHRLRGELPPLDSGRRVPRVDVVVVGAGISGLVAARALARRGHSVRVLEQARVPGGNSKSERWADVEYSIGAACFTLPDPGTDLDRLYRDLRITARATRVPKGETLMARRLATDFWSGATDPAHAAATRRIRDTWRAMLEERYPEIPWTGETRGWSREQFERADREPFAHALQALGAPPHVRAFCEYYCWSSFGGSAAEISTYAALNFLTAEFGQILALPGGNAAIARALIADLERLGVQIATGRLAARVRRDRDGVEVAALHGGGGEHQPARACVLAVPRFIARHVVEEFPAERAAIVEGMKWRAYVVANVLLGRRPRADWYDAYRIEPLDPRDCGFTDLILADFAVSKRAERSVITAYRALPYDGGRAELLEDDDFARHRDAVRRDLAPWLDALGLAEEDIVDINLARWGHPLVLAQPGQLAAGGLERLSAPLGRVAFAHQDRYGVPAIENAIAAGLAAAREAEAALA